VDETALRQETAKELVSDILNKLRLVDRRQVTVYALRAGIMRKE